MRSRELFVTAFATRLIPRIARVKMVLALVALQNLAVFGDAHSFCDRFVCPEFHRNDGILLETEEDCQAVVHKLDWLLDIECQLLFLLEAFGKFV